MNKYWEFYKTENYDSLKNFYLPKGDNPDERSKNLIQALHELHVNYGSVKKIDLIEKTSGINTDYGENIELVYQVSHDTKLIEHQFKFIKKGGGPFKIIDHSFTQ